MNYRIGRRIHWTFRNLNKVSSIKDFSKRGVRRIKQRRKHVDMAAGEEVSSMWKLADRGRRCQNFEEVFYGCPQKRSIEIPSDGLRYLSIRSRSSPKLEAASSRLSLKPSRTSSLFQATLIPVTYGLHYPLYYYL